VIIFFIFENEIAGRGVAWCDLAAGAAAGRDHLFIFENEIAGRGVAWCDLAAGAAAGRDHLFIFENEIAGRGAAWCESGGRRGGAGAPTIRRRAAPARVK
jgi:hypothetical protein